MPNSTEVENGQNESIESDRNVRDGSHTGRRELLGVLAAGGIGGCVGGIGSDGESPETQAPGTDTGTSDTDSVHAVLSSAGRGVAKGASGPESIDGDQPFIRMVEGSTASFELECESGEQNYVTLKLWGGSGKKKTQLRFPNIPHDGHNYKQRKAAPHPDRFCYVTTELPMERTAESPVELDLKCPSGGDIDIYDVSVHTDPFYEPAPDELQGKPVKTAIPQSAGDSGSGRSPEEIAEHWRSEVMRGVEAALEKQIWGDLATKLIENGDYPEWARGAFLCQWPNTTDLIGPYADLATAEGDLEKSEYKAYGGFLLRQGASTGMKRAMRNLNLIAIGYTKEWSDYYQDEDMLDRFVACMDFVNYAQGSNGAMMQNHHYSQEKYTAKGHGGFQGWPKWIGVPDRQKGGNIFSNGQKYLWPAYRMMHEHLQSSGVLDETFNHDLDPSTEPLKRRTAYTEMAKRSVQLFKGKVRGRRIANQSLHNLEPLLQVHKALDLLNRFEAQQFEDEIRKTTKVGVGLERHPKGHYLQSPDGMANEFGWSGGYGGQHAGQMAKVAELAPWDFVDEQTRQHYKARAHMLYLRNNGGGYPRLTIPEWISRRAYIGIPGRPQNLANQYAAEELEIPEAIRSYEMEFQAPGGDGDLRTAESIGQHGHLSSGAVRAADLAENVLSPGDLPATDYRFPTEREDTTVFVDEYLEALAIHQGDATCLVRFWFDKPWARVAHKAPEFDRYARFKTADFGPTKTGDMFKTPIVRTLSFGPYFVALNGSTDQSHAFTVPAELQGTRMRDLTTNEELELQKEHTLDPMTSYVLTPAN